MCLLEIVATTLSCEESCRLDDIEATNTDPWLLVSDTIRVAATVLLLSYTWHKGHLF